MYIETDRLIITEFTNDMAEAVHLNSLDEDNRKFLPDEVFETIDEAVETIEFLIKCYETSGGPLVYPILTKNGDNIGYVQAAPIDDNQWEIGYHIGIKYTKNGYASEAVKAFVPVVMQLLGISQILAICDADNIASVKVAKRSGFVKIFEGLGQYQGQERMICKFIFNKNFLFSEVCVN